VFYPTGNSELILKYDPVKEDEMCRACSTNEGEEECIWDIGGKGGRR
jgi:hypothetical protein